MTKNSLKEIIKLLPATSGVYQYYDQKGQLLYVGKAINLKKRVSSYFNRNDLDPKTALLVRQIASVSTIVTQSEAEALLLEDLLVKKYRPPYNIDLKDDKRYPYFCLTLQEEYPRLIVVRRRKNDGNKYFGPYAGSIQSVLRIIKQFFPLRKCNYQNLAKVSRTCVYYQIKQCLGPCVYSVKDEYRQVIQQLELFLQGKYEELHNSLRKNMQEYSRNLEYEKAAKIRDNLQVLERVISREAVQASKIISRDLKNLIDRQQLKNKTVEQGLQGLQNILNLKQAPVRLDCFDISHIQGAETVGAMTVFRHGRPDKKEYRKYIIHLSQPNDFAAMQEVLSRRYLKVATGEQEAPDLIIIDGGKGQLQIAVKVLATLKLSLPIVSIAKQQEELFIPGKKNSLLLKRNDPALKIIQQIRDEAHRFAIEFHRLRRSKRTLYGNPDAKRTKRK